MKKETFFKIASFIPAIFLMAVIFCFSAQHSDESARTSLSFINWIRGVLGFNFSQSFIRTTAHGCEYFLLSFCLSFAFFYNLKRISSIAPIIVCLLYAFSDEIHQFFVPGRAFQMKDIMADVCGAALGSLVFLVIVLLIGKIKRKSSAFISEKES